MACTVVDGDPPFSFTWYKDGAELKEIQGFNIQETSDGFTSTLSIPKLEASSNGNYSCKVSNSKGMDKKYGMLLVKGSYCIYIFFKTNFILRIVIGMISVNLSMFFFFIIYVPEVLLGYFFVACLFYLHIHNHLI